jgi:hypothetical protein
MLGKVGSIPVLSCGLHLQAFLHPVVFVTVLIPTPSPHPRITAGITRSALI